MDTESTLVSLAMLKLKTDGGSDYFDYLRPFILQLLAEGVHEPITDTAIARSIKDKYGLIIPARTVQIVLKRLSKKGTITRRNNAYYINQNIEHGDWSVEHTNALRKINYITKALVDYSKEHLDKDITEEDAIDCFTAFLSQFTIPCLKIFIRGTVLPDIEQNGNWKIILVSQFIKYIEKHSLEKFESFMLLVQGNMLANALLCPDLKHATKSYEGVTFFFDTTLIIRALGLSGKEEKESTNELLSLLLSLDAKLAYFAHTQQELKAIIDASADKIDHPRGYGSIVFEARQANTTRSDLLLIAEKLEEQLSELGLHKKETPPYTGAEIWQIDESKFEEILDNQVRHAKHQAKLKDINSVRSIYVLRGNLSPTSLEQCKAILVTSNTNFAKAAQEYGETFNQSKDVSTVITDFSLINISWLKAPLGAPSLPRKEVLAYAYAALCPTKEFLNKVINEAEKLEEKGIITPRDHQLIRSHPSVLFELHKLTLGDDSALSETSILMTIERIENEIKQEETAKLNAAYDENKELHERYIKEINEKEEIKKKLYWKIEKTVKLEAYIVSALLAGVLIPPLILLLLLHSYELIFHCPLPHILTADWLLALANWGSLLSIAITAIGIVKDVKVFKFYQWYFEWRFNKKLQQESKLLGVKLFD